MADANSFDALIERFISERLTPDELPLFFRFLEEEDFQRRYAGRIDMDLIEETWLGWSNGQQADRLYNNILQAGNIPVRDKAIAGSENIHTIKRTRWTRYAAAALLLLAGLAVYRYGTKNHITQIAHVTPPPSPVMQDVLPGQNKAILILGDKSVVPLDSLANGATVLQGGMKIVKEAGGKIDYVPAQGPGQDGVIPRNTVRTPRGGQYQLVLSDGTRVWLNAASSITYPARFTDSDRTVSISGEAYFEVAKNTGSPFFVKIDNSDSKVEVLGTHFNINAYEDESAIKTTLLEGKVKVSGGNASVILKPGQQSSGTRVNDKVDVTQVMSWKNGVFTFEGKTIQQVLRELARWYDLTIVYGKEIPDIKLRGEMGMNLNLSQVLKGLAAMEVICRLEPGKKLLVFP
ncbi:MAG: FecR domain-containing protein [Chitinophagaceae bacterium]|nr:FecR domain-containing protein [Chitinophagaceae bacterium]